MDRLETLMALYDDMPLWKEQEGLGAGDGLISYDARLDPSRYGVTSNRVSSQYAQQALDLFAEIYQERITELTQAIQNAVSEYEKAKPAAQTFDGKDFVSHLEETKAASDAAANALACMADLGKLFYKIEQLGLTNFETFNSYDYLLRPIAENIVYGAQRLEPQILKDAIDLVPAVEVSGTAEPEAEPEADDVPKDPEQQPGEQPAPEEGGDQKGSTDGVPDDPPQPPKPKITRLNVDAAAQKVISWPTPEIEQWMVSESQLLVLAESYIEQLRRKIAALKLDVDKRNSAVTELQRQAEGKELAGDAAVVAAQRDKAAAQYSTLQDRLDKLTVEHQDRFAVLGKVLDAYCGSLSLR